MKAAAENKNQSFPQKQQKKKTACCFDIDKQKFDEIVQSEIQKIPLNVKITTICFWGISLCLFAYGLLLYLLLQMGLDIREETYKYVVIWCVGSFCSTLAIFGSLFLIKKVFEPLEELSEASLKVAGGDFDVQIKYRGNLAEMENTIENFNRMVKELDSVEIMRNDFVADVSHEFKTPLAAITGYTTFLQDPDLTVEERDEYIKKIHFNVDKLNELTENILRLSKLEHQQFLDEPVRYRLDEQIREAIVLLEPKWGKKNTNFELELPELFYTGQKSLLFQVWMNIIGNAVKYTDIGGIVQVTLKKTDTQYEVFVKDNGVGMTEETVKHIFDKFYQGDTSRKFQGNGLGLALCREIISKCRGSIEVESVEREGSLFVVRLPAKFI